MINNKIDKMIASALKNRETDLLNVLKLIKTEFVNAKHNNVELNEVNETKILLKMASQREDSIQQYINGGRKDLAEAEKKELDIIKLYTPKQATDEEISEYTSGVITSYKATKDEGYVLSMKDMKPIMSIVKEKYPNANGKVVSTTLMKVINNK
jgi:uncharacterized protein